MAQQVFQHLGQFWVGYLLITALITWNVKVVRYFSANATKDDLKKGIKTMSMTAQEDRQKIRDEIDQKLQVISEERREIWAVIRDMDKKMDNTRECVFRIEGYLQRMERNGKA